MNKIALEPTSGLASLSAARPRAMAPVLADRLGHWSERPKPYFGEP